MEIGVRLTSQAKATWVSAKLKEKPIILQELRKAAEARAAAAEARKGR